MDDRRIFSSYWGHEQVVAHFNDEFFIATLLQFESSLASCQEDLGIIPKDAVFPIQEAISSVIVDDELIEKLNASTADNGIPTIALVAAIKEKLDKVFHKYLHYGVTSQDLIDTAHMKALQQLNQDFIRLLGQGLRANVLPWLQQADWICMARTRQQQALPVTFGYKLYHWFMPLLASLESLQALQFPVSLGGPVGDMRAFGSQGKALTAALAAKMGLDDFGAVWHQNRQPVLAILNAYEGVLIQLRKILQDWLFLANSEVGELRLESKGKSSAMAHKNNPVQLEQAMVLVKIALDSVQNYKQHAIFSSERDGVSWTLEWYYLTGLDTQLQLVVHAFMKTMGLIEWQKEAIEAFTKSFEGQLQEPEFMPELMDELERKLKTLD
ncbi:MAG: hypothetical protein LC670_06575 [Flavobacteriales bacterium]|nr:hypothetical protein [Flavobacteriales bacterium]